ncbi:LRR receptor-like serine/threonine-protein kinase GSO1 [Cinnamomum micranthum f. kanehirae]|uniref:LRR receptor-like serine/threonine-protein kinase GSO1 n=1 Tax=Cinnamomum micranthum f. kanehirae TaxID=337451 RepID=A0A3S3NUT4_9MAGN|nr:LRR receptor-like serine/threonine-protein kinase GSO1 [Cinnamomum micranthum f. kanehirae]
MVTFSYIALNRSSILSKLEELDLSYNSLNEIILPFLAALKSLKKLEIGEKICPNVLLLLSFLLACIVLHILIMIFQSVIPPAIETLTSLRAIDFAWNGFNDPQSIQGFCKLKDLQRLDLSYNYFKGPIPLCLGNLTSLQLLNLSNNGFSGMLQTSTTGNDESQGPLPIKVLGLSNCKLNKDTGGGIPNFLYSQREVSIPYFSYPLNVDTRDIYFYEEREELKEVEFITKRKENYYKGGILNYMSGIDVSCNQLTGEIPHEMGQLSGLHSMNLSHNQFTGPIPATFKNLSQIESLDLSHNKLNGTIPSELIELYFLSVFSVAYNNLSARTPDKKNQFSTFNESSYEGNQLLCGPPLSRSCISTAPISEAPNEEDENEDNENIVSFYGSFAGSYLVFLIGTIGVIYFTSQRRAMCFLYVVDSWCAFHLYKLYRLFSRK